MPKYITNGIIVQKGRALKDGAVIELTEEQAERLGRKVIPLEVADPDKPIDTLNLKELKDLAKAAGVEGYSRKDKASLVSVLTHIQQGIPASEPELETFPDVVVSDDESDGN